MDASPAAARGAHRPRSRAPPHGQAQQHPSPRGGRRADRRHRRRGGDAQRLPRVLVQRHLLPGPARRPRRPQARPAAHPLRHERARAAARPPAREVEPGRRRGHGQVPPARRPAIYDALVRMAQPFTMRLPLVDGHGNFGSLDDGPAASRYTEARMAPAALLMVAGLDEDTVDYVPNYDDSLLQPGVMPAAYPNLLVNGASGIAVGMATNMAPHNLVEVIGAARHLIAHPDCSLDDLMRFVPGPDLPGGGRIIGLDGIRDAYLTGRGTFRTRAAARVEKLTPRRMGIVVTELPYLVGPEKVIERVKTLVQSKKLQGISDVKDLTDRKHGLRLVFEVKNGFNPDAVLEQLYKLTPMEDSFGINNVALVDGQPRTLGLKELLATYVGFRIRVVRRRTEFRLRKRKDRLHLVEGLLIAILDIDEVIQLIRTSDDAAAARARLISVFDLSEAAGRVHPRAPAAPAHQVLPHRARDRARRARPPDRGARGDPRRREAAPPHRLRRARRRRQGPRHPAAHRPPRVGRDAGHVRDAPRGRRRPVLGAAVVHRPAGPHVVGRPGAGRGRPCQARRRRRRRAHHGSRRVRPRHLGGPDGADVGARAADPAAARRRPQPVRRRPARRLRRPARRRGAADDRARSTPTARASRSARRRASSSASRPTTPPAATGRSSASRTATGSSGRSPLRDGAEDLVFVTSDAQLLRFPASAVRPQGRAAGGMAGIRLSAGAVVTFFGAVDPTADAVVVTSSGSSDALPGTQPGSLKVTPYAEYPAKGRGTGGVRAHRFLRGEDTLVLAWVGARAGPGVRRQRRRPRPPRGHGPARRVRHGLPGGRRGHRLAGPLTAAQSSRVTQSLPAGGARPLRDCVNAFTFGPGSLIAEATPASARPVKWRRAMALISKRRYRGVVRSPRGGPDRDGLRRLGGRRRRRRERVDQTTIDCAPYEEFGDLKGKTVTVYTSITAPGGRSSPGVLQAVRGVHRRHDQVRRLQGVRGPAAGARQGRQRPRHRVPPPAGSAQDHGRDRAGQAGSCLRSPRTSTSTCPTRRRGAPSTTRSTRLRSVPTSSRSSGTPRQMFKDAGYEVPKTWDELLALSDKIVADNPGGDVKPWCAGIESGDATGWTATDWMEDVMLRTAGPETYDKWVDARDPVQRPCCRHGDRRGRQDPQERQVRQRRRGRRQDDRLDVLPGRRPADPRRLVLHAPPGVVLRGQLARGHQGRRGRRRVGVLPPRKGRGEQAGPRSAASSPRPSPTAPRSRRSRPTSRRSSGPTSGRRPAALGGCVTANTQADATLLKNPVDKLSAEILTDKAATSRFDGSDLMPGAVGSGTFWKGMTDWIIGQDDKTTLDYIEQSWPK